MTDKLFLTDEAKAALEEQGVLPHIRQAVYVENDVATLKRKAEQMAESLQELLDSGKLTDGDIQKLVSVLSRLRGAISDSILSRDALAVALSEAVAVLNVVEGNGRGTPQQQKIDHLWQHIEQANKDIDDDFEKMRKAGIVFDEKLWNKHKELSDYLQEHPHDIEKQKELDGVDDLLLLKAEPQLKAHPSAKPHFNDAKTKSKQRHQMVDHDLAEAEKRIAILDSNTATDWSMSITADKHGKDVNLNDVEPQNIGQKTKAPEKNIILSLLLCMMAGHEIISEIFVQIQTNVCFRTKLTQRPVLFPFYKIANP